jgi:hypothetical protein
VPSLDANRTETRANSYRSTVKAEHEESPEIRTQAAGQGEAGGALVGRRLGG